MTKFPQKAKWISHPSDDHSPAPVFKYDFTFEKSKYVRVSAFISGLGLFEAHINGQRLGDTEFDPGESVFGKRAYYVEYDVTPLLINGANTIEITVGNGQYCNFRVNPTMEKDGRPAEPHRYQKNDGAVFSRGIYGKKCMIAELIGVSADGKEDVIASSGTDWLTSFGHVTFNDWYGGEDFDATQSADAWERAVTVPSPTEALTPRTFTPIKTVSVTPAVSVTKTDTGTYVVDFGKNGAGVPELCLMTSPADRGRKITLYPAEELDENGHADQRSSTQSWSQTKSCRISDSYVIAGTGHESWHPHFCYHGFRYVEVEGFPGAPTPENFNYRQIRTANEKNGYLVTDNDIINRINEITERSIESNMFGAFTDCPQIEKLGWLETSHLMFRSMAYGYDIQGWMPKIVADICDSQVTDAESDRESVGYVPAIAPEYHRIMGLHRDPNWGGAVILTPWNHYVFYGDTSLIERAYPNMKAYLSHLEGFEHNGLLTDYAQMGDWGQINERTPTRLVENCAYYKLITTVSKIAAILGHAEDKRYYAEKAEAVKLAFHKDRLCYNAETHVYGNGSQSSCGCVLYSGIVSEENTAETVQALADAVEKSGFHLTSGEVGLKQVLTALNLYGHNDLAYRIIMNPTPPGYRYFIDKGLTALPEYWNYEELWWGMVRSRNHAMMGHVKQWLTEALLGVRPVGDSYEHIIIAPYIPDDVRHVKGGFVCGFGRIDAEWRVVSDGIIDVRYSVPENVKVTVILPDGYTRA